MADLVDTFIARMQVEGEAAVTKLQSAINRLNVEMDKQTAGAEKNAAANQKAAAAGEASAAVDEKITKAKRTTTNELERWIARMDKASKLELQHRNDLERLKRLEEEQTGTATDRAFALELVNKKLQDGLALLNKSTTATVENTRALVDNLAVQERINRTTGVTRGPAGPTPAAPKTQGELRDDDIQAYGQSLDALRAKYNPLFAAEQSHKEELAEINRVLRLGAIDVNEHAEAIDKETRAYQKQIVQLTASKAALDAQRAAERIAPTAIQQRINTSTGVSGGSDSATRAADIEAYATELDQLQAKYDPLFAAQKRFEAAQEEINRALQVGAINTELHRTALNKAEDAYTSEIVKIRGAATATDTHNKALTEAEKKSAAAAKGTGQFNAAVTNLGFQINDVATGLLSGQSPFTILAQQGGQIAQAFSQGGGAGAVMKGFADTIKSAISPTTLLVGGVVALVGSVILLAIRQSEAEARLRGYNVALDVMGAKSETTAADLEEATKALRDQGVAADTANKAMLALVHTPGINKAAAQQISQLALDISGERGTDLVAQAQALGKAVAGTADQLGDFNQELGVVYTDAENKAITASKIARDEMKQRGIEYAALQRTYEGANERNKSDFQKQIDAMKKVWNEFLDLMGPPALTIVTDFFKEFNTLIKNTANELRLLKELWEWGKSHLPSWGGDDPTGARAAAEAQARGARGGTDLSAPKTGDSASMQQGIQFFLDKGLALEHATGIVSRLALESGSGTALIPSAVNPTSGAYGIAQALGSRQPAYKAAGDNLQAQLEVVWQEFTTTELAAFREILKTTTAKDAAIAMEKFERAGEPDFTAKAGDLATRVMETNKGLTAAAGTPAYLPPVETTAKDPNAPTGRGKIVLDNQLRQAQIERENMGLLGREAAIAAAKVAALTAVLNENMTPKEKEAFVTRAMTLEAEKFDKAQAANLETERLRTEGIERTTKAILQGEIPGIEAAAQVQAEMDKRLGTANDVQAQRQAILKRGAAEAINASAKALPVLGQQVEQSGRLAKATALGTAAEHAAVLENQVATATHEALAKAIASKNPELIKQAKLVTEATAALVKRNDVLQQTYQLEQQINQRNNQIEVLKLTATLQFETAEEMQRQVALLQAKQDLEARGLTAADDIYQKTLQNVDALGQQNIKLAEASRTAGVINDAIKGVATTVDTTLTDSIDAAFSGKKVKDWGATIKETIGGITKQLISGMFVKPIIGSLLSAVGFGKVGAEFGSIGGVFGALGLGGGGSSAGGTGTTTESGGVNTGTLLQGGGLLKDIFGGSGGEGFLGGIGSSLKSGFNSVGEFLGFANPATTAASQGLPLAGTVGPTLPTGSLFGTTTLGGFLGGAGAGFGAGMLLNNVLGGNQVGGTIGSAGGALAGAAIGSIIPGIGTLAGGLIGGAAGGGLGGLFGGTKKPDAASGGVINLATGQIQNAVSGGNAQNDATASQIGTVLGKAVQLALAIPGAKLPGGAVAIQAGSRDGIKLSYAGMSQKFDSAEAAIAFGLNALRDNLTGVSETVQKVIHSIGSPDQIEGALAFAAAYDKLSESVDNAFKDIETAAKTGPYELVKQQIDAVFAGMAQQAQDFGLAVEPVNKALEEATRRLNDDFSKAVDKAFNSATGRDFLDNVQNVIDGYEQMAKDASAIGADTSIHDKLGQTFVAELNTIFAGLSGPQLDEVINKFGDLTNGLPDLARAAKAAAEASAALSRQLERQSVAYQIQQDSDTAAGKGFLAQLRDLDKTRIAGQAQVTSLGLGDARSGVVQETEHRNALTILQGLTNDQLEDARKTLEELNPAFGAWVDEAYAMIKASKDATDQTDKLAKAQERANQILQAGLQIRQWLNAQETGQDFTSPQSRLEAARSQFQTQLGLARGGDVDALQGITQIADQLKSALQGWFASSAPGAQEWEDVKAALASLPGVPNAQQTSTNAIVDAIAEAATATVAGNAEATTASTAQIIGTTIATNQAIVDNARATARDIVFETGQSSGRIVTAAIDTSNDIVRNAIDGSARITGATTSGAELVSGATLLVANAANSTAEAVSYQTDVSKGGTLALLASNEANSKTLIAGSKEDTQNLLAQQEQNAGALLAANAQQSAALVDQNIRNATAVVNTTNATAQSIVAGNSASAASIIDTATQNTEAARATANDNTADMIWTANATSTEVAARNDAAGRRLELTTEAGTNTLLAHGKDAVAAQISTAQSTTATSVAAAYETSNQIGARTEAASANVAATTKAGTDALVARSDAQIAALQALTGVSIGDVTIATAIYSVGGWIVGDNAAWNNAIYQQIAAYGTWAVQSNEAWSNAIVQTIAGWGGAINNTTWQGAIAVVNTVAGWSNLLNYTIWAAGDAGWRTTDAWGNAICGTIGAWGNATVGTISYWGNADISYQAWAANGIVNMLAQVANSITNSIFANGNIEVGAIYGSSSNEIGGMFANGNAIIGAIGSMSVGNIAATFAAANTIVAQVAASGNNPGWIVDHINWLRNDNNWWNDAINASTNRANDNNVAWNQNLWNKLNDMHYTLNVYLSKIADNTWVIREYIHLLTEVTIQFDIWMAAKTDAQHDALVDIETNLRRQAFG